MSAASRRQGRSRSSRSRRLRASRLFNAGTATAQNCEINGLLINSSGTFLYQTTA
jgi:hypothetical protein